MGETSNPTIFQAAITKSSDYDQQLKDLHRAGADASTAIRELTTDDVREACDVFAPVVQRTGGLDGRVSIEVDPRLARDTARTIAEAHALWTEVDRPNLYIKIPATVEGLPAITDVTADGISVNITLIFSIERYQAVMDAYATRPRAATGARRVAGRHPVRRVVLRQPGRHRGRQAARGDRHATRHSPCAARQRSPTRGSPSRRSSSSSPPSAGSGSRPPARRGSVRSGHPPAPRTPTIPTRCMSPSS